MATSPKHSYIRFFTVVVALLLGLILVRLAFLTLQDQSQSKTYTNPQVASKVVRGTIYDRNHRILAIQTPYWGVYFHLNYIKDLQVVSELVAPYVQMSPQQVQDKAKQYTTYAQIKARIDEDQVPALLATLEKHKLTKEVTVEKRLGRTYPALFHASQTLGFINSEQEGIEGVELSQEHYLNPYPEVGQGEVTYGEDITLTLDLDIQYALDVQLQFIADEHNPDYAMALVLDATNGDILGMSSYPWYDVNSLSTSTAVQRKNHAANLLFEPGSVFKLFSLATVLEAGQANVTEPFLCDGSYTFSTGSSNVTINCTAPHGLIDPKTMIAKSCNGAIVHWAMQTDADLFYETLTKLGFNSSYDIGLPCRPRAQIAEPSTWSGRSQATISFGQEMLASALHLAAAATALTQEGELLQPHLILSRSDAVTAEKTYQRERTVLAKVFSGEVAKTVRAGMQQATEEGGTGVKAVVEGVDVGIKTGTAQLLNPETNTYEDGTVLASSLAMVPIDNPRYIIYFGAGNPKGNTIWGSNIAGPAIANVVKALLSQGKLVAKDTEIR
ncbi:MAG: penicillin-binding protein 2 [Spirochaetia bacterium]|nr:penicillin-binding protein 2 [Spirochaetia bacterium]